jgi:pSer/pThr/pTyr-binding forkhead associated (FHA) protein
LAQDSADAVLENAFQTGNIIPKQYNAIDQLPAASPPPIPAILSGPIRADLRLLMLNTGRRLDCPDRSNIIIGRGDAITGEIPDIDLGSDDALELGVSRRHACITFRDGLPFVTDLGSTNRTFINRQVLMRGQPYAIKDGDEIRMGNAILKVIYKP